MCGDERHSDKIFFCRKFKGQKLTGKKAALKKPGACRKCLGCHGDEGYRSDTYLCRNKVCKRGGATDPHYFLFPEEELKRGRSEEKSGKF